MQTADPKKQVIIRENLLQNKRIQVAASLTKLDDQPCSSLQVASDP